MLALLHCFDFSRATAGLPVTRKCHNGSVVVRATNVIAWTVAREACLGRICAFTDHAHFEGGAHVFRRDAEPYQEQPDEKMNELASLAQLLDKLTLI